MRTHAFSAAALLLLTACYAYRPTTVEMVPVGAEFRGLLATETRIALEDSLRIDLGRLEGTLVARNGDSLLVAVQSVDPAFAAEGRPLYQRITLARRDVMRVDVKQIDKARTIALLAGVATIATVAILRGFDSNPGRPDGGGGGPPESPPIGQIRIPLP